MGSNDAYNQELNRIQRVCRFIEGQTLLGRDIILLTTTSRACY